LTATPTQTQTQTQSGTPNVTPTPSVTQTQTPSPTATPALPNARFHIDASATHSITSDPITKKVSRWNDLSTNNYDLVNSDVSRQPILTSSTLNSQVTGLPCVQFDGSFTAATFLNSSGFSFNDSGFTYLFVAGISRAEPEGFVFNFDDGNNSDPGKYSLFSQNIGGGGDGIEIGIDNIVDKYIATDDSILGRYGGLYLGVVTGITDGSSVQQYSELNDELPSSEASRTVPNTITNIFVGLGTGTTSQYAAISEIMELMVFDTVLSGTQIDAYESYLKSKWSYSSWLQTATPTPSPTRTPTQTPSQTQTQTPSPTRFFRTYTFQAYTTCGSFIGGPTPLNTFGTFDTNRWYCLDYFGGPAQCLAEVAQNPAVYFPTVIQGPVTNCNNLTLC
jgi:hypothetical protein